MSESFGRDVEHLIRAIEKNIYEHPESVIGHLRELLRRCNSDAQLGYTYTQLGFAYLLLSEHRMSRIFYEHALSLQPNNAYVLANLAHAAYELGDKATGVAYGRRALRLKDEMVMAAKRDIGEPRCGRTNLISFSLYGNKAKYCETAVLNCVAAMRYFPGFVCRFYVDGSVPDNVIRRLRAHSAEIVRIGGPAASFPPTFWRFLAMDEQDANLVLVRDADSIIDAREAHCVGEWMESGKPFHIIRDDCCHTELIHAGLFAAQSGIVRDMEDKIAGFIASPENQPIGRFSDQLFLRKCVWPIVRECAVTHDSVYGYGTDVRGIRSDVPGDTGVRNYFIGANFANYLLKVSAPEAFSAGSPYFVRIIDDAGRVVCEYQMDLVSPRELQIFLPQSYARQLEAGAWKYEIYS